MYGETTHARVWMNLGEVLRVFWDIKNDQPLVIACYGSF